MNKINLIIEVVIEQERTDEPVFNQGRTVAEIIKEALLNEGIDAQTFFRGYNYVPDEK